MKLLVALVMGLAAAAAAVEVVRVDTVYGPVDGQTITLEDGSKVNSFYGIPFAKPPVGDLRWRKPERPDPWTEPRPANVLNAACPQSEVGLIWASHPLWKKYDEDCLYLNIFTPADMSKTYPVMIWFHGGGFAVSSNVQYPGHFLAQRDVVVVVPNYRLGALGFMSTEDDAARGNYGLHDQVFAMKFVQENIAKFGGDKDKVTLFGQSAGAASSTLHLLIPESHDLFHQVLPQSGSELAFWAVLTPSHHPANYTKQVARKLSCPTDDTTAMMDCMRKLPWKTVQQNQGFTCEEGFYCLGFSPVVDGELLPDTPMKLREEGKFKNCPMMAGLTSDDGSLYTIALIPESLEGGFNRTDFERVLRDLVDIFAPLMTEKAADDVFRAMLWYYARHPYINDMELNRDAFNEMVTDVGFGYHSELSLRYHAEAGNPVYYYRLGYISERAWDIIPEWMGVFHSADIPYTFQWPLMTKNRQAAYDSGIFFEIVDYNELDLQFSEYIADLWTNFAKFGNPTPVPVNAPGDNEPTIWPMYNTSTFHYLHMFEKVEVKTGYRSRNHAFFYEFLDYLSGLDFLPAPYSNEGKPRRTINTDEIRNRIDEFFANLVKESQTKRKNTGL